MAASAKIYNRL